MAPHLSPGRVFFIRVLLCAALVLLATSRAPAAEPPLVLAARAWGLAKYHHPEVTRCAVDWDQALLDAFPQLDAASTAAEAGAAVAALLARAGETPRALPTAATPAWIVAAQVDPALRERLAWLAAQRPLQQCYVSAAPGTGQATFETDRGHPTAEPDRAHRALAAFRFWNAIEYFFPYKQDIGRDWAAVLSDTLPAVLAAQTRYDYVAAIRILTAAIEDSHAFLVHPPIHDESGFGAPDFSVALIEGRTIVTQRGEAAGPVQPGDELLAVDGTPLADRIAEFAPLAHGSHPLYRHTMVLRSAINGTSPTGSFRLRRPDGSAYEAQLPRGFQPASPLADRPTWSTVALDGCSMGLLDMARLQPQEVGAALDALRDTDAIVVDVRNYPNGTLWPIVDQLYPTPRAAAHFTRPRLERPGEFELTVAPIGGRTPQPYGGRLLLLQDERSISQSEYTLMGLQATGQALVFGSQTAAADGNITWVYLPGDIRAIWTGLGVYYPDGRATQRIGIVPDLHVRPTIAGLADGRDEVLEAALDCRWLSAEPERRLPSSGLYYSPERNGEGLDVHRAGTVGAVLSYGYDATGAPVWALSAGALEDDAWSTRFHHYGGGPEPDAPVPGYAMEFHRGAYTPACAIADQNALHPRGRWQWQDATGTARETCVVPLLLSGNGNATGLWAGPPAELGWGVSVHQSPGRVSVVVYAYDGAGQPRWLLGNADWDGTGEAVIALLRVQGFCRGCAAVPIQTTPAGTLRLRFEGLDASNGSDGSGRLDIDADFGDGVAWQRTNMPLTRLMGRTP